MVFHVPGVCATVEHLERFWNRNLAIFNDPANVLKEHLPFEFYDKP
jgi:hypothetical protein